MSSLRFVPSCLLVVASHMVAGQTPLPVPDTLSGSVIDLSLVEGTREFSPGEPISTYGYNGDLLGPTLILNQGQEVTLNVTNTLPDLTTTHWHGLHVSPENDGGPHSLIFPNTTWSPSFTVLDRASTFWYHPHGHGLTDFQVSMGASGMIIVRDPLEAALDLPRTYGVDDIPLILQTKAIVDGQVQLHTGLDSVVLANGVRNAWKELPARIVRLRCLNGASERTFLLGFSNDMTFHVIGTDGGLLEAPVALDRLRLMPGERAEILIDLNSMEGQEFQLMSYASELPNNIVGAAQVGNGMATLDGYDDNALNGADFALVSFTVGGALATGTTSLPVALVPTNAYDVADVDVTRPFTFQPQAMDPMGMIEGPFLINGDLMDMDVINETVTLGSTEIWEFTNNTMVGHPIHIHDIQFNVLDRNGLPPEPWERGWKDVVFVPSMGSARVITRFDDFADPDMPYMYHCHLLMHEDEGMMGQFLVVDPNTIAERDAVEDLRIWPNPSHGGTVQVGMTQMSGPAVIEVHDCSGRRVHVQTVGASTGPATLDLVGLAPGAYRIVLVPADHRLPHAATTLIVQH